MKIIDVKLQYILVCLKKFFKMLIGPEFVITGIVCNA